MLEELDLLSIILDLQNLTSEEQMVTQMVSFQCLEFSTTLLDTVIKVEVRERELSLFTSSHGILILKNSLSLERTMVRKSKEQEISSMLSGFQISS